VKEFAEYFMKSAAKIAKEVKYVPLPAKAYTLGLEHIAKMKKGTVMGGKNEVGIRTTTCWPAKPRTACPHARAGRLQASEACLNAALRRIPQAQSNERGVLLE
jgi:hypothetical protein